VVGCFVFYHGASVIELFNEKAAAHAGDILARNGRCRIPKAPELAENVFDLVEDGGAALGRLVFNLQRGVKLFHELALVFGQFCRR
jgi:hypothetical protein